MRGSGSESARPGKAARAGAILGGLALLACPGCAEAPRPRNLLLISIDTLRADHLGPYGSPLPTPAVDALAAEGVVVEGACTPTPSTGPAHVSLMTGLHPWRHGVLLNAVAVDDGGPPLLAERLRDAGFATGGFVSSFNLDRRFGFARGFDSFGFEGELEHAGQERFYSLGERTTQRALDWLDRRGNDRFFLFLHYFDPHAPYDPPPGFERPPREVVDLAGRTKPPELPDMRTLVRAIWGYRGTVVYSDAQVGRLVERLRETDRLDETLVVVTSDHGEEFGEHGRLGHGRQLHDELLEIPLILRGAGLPAGRRVQGPAQLEDLLPTVLSLLGVPPGAAVDGTDLSPWLRGEVETSPRPATLGRIADFPDEPALFYARRWPEKWIGELDGRGVAYRLDRDRGERNGTPGAPPPETLRALAGDVRRPGRERRLDDESRQALEALGYLEPGAETETR